MSSNRPAQQAQTTGNQRLIIPPLPSSKLFTVVDKENARQPQANNNSNGTTSDNSNFKAARGKQSNVKALLGPTDVDQHANMVSRKRQSIHEQGGRETKQGRSGQTLPQNHFGGALRTDVTTSSPSPKEQKSRLGAGITTPIRVQNVVGKGRVLRFGETIESLFCLIEDSTEEHVRLCENIANGDKADDAASWRRALEIASARDPLDSSEDFGQALLRLHRRATSRFNSLNSMTSDGHTTEDVLAMWISYARAHSKYGSRDDARLTYRHIQNKRLAENQASFYVALAEFELEGERSSSDEGNVERAMEALRLGLKKNAEPVEDLKFYLNKLEMKRNGATDNCTVLQGHTAGDSQPYDHNNEEAVPTDQASLLHSKQVRFESHQFNIPPLPTSSIPLSMNMGSWDPCLTKRREVDIKSNVVSVKRFRDAQTGLSPNEVAAHQNKLTGTNGLKNNSHLSSLDFEDGLINLPSTEDETDSIVVFKLHDESIVAENRGDDPDDITIPLKDRKFDGDHAELSVETEDQTTTEDLEEIRDFQTSEIKPTSNVDEKSQVQNESNVTAELREEGPAIVQKRYNRDTGTSKTSFSGETVKTINDDTKTSEDLRLKTESSRKEKSAGGKVGILSKGNPLLSQRRLGGGAIRVEAMGALCQSDEDSEENANSSTSEKTEHKKNGVKGSAHSVPKISRMDISYMLEWSPSAPKRQRKCDLHAQDERQQKLENSNPVRFNLQQPMMEKIEEESPTEALSKAAAGSAASTTSSWTASGASHPTKTSGSSSLNTRTSGSTDGTGSGSALDGREQDKHLMRQLPTPSNDQPVVASNNSLSVSPEATALVAKSNIKFLSLASEDNILRVNNVPYAKLGVIGKGGSCKVYRVLSPEWSVLAIKKVKLAGMDKKAIDGYANEIALLKTLRGNPAIIQMYDSEVDLQRKAIFLVMELGEVDLNCLLQQQASLEPESIGSSKKQSLGINFIRLTWQQMLSAVHSIHEERIVHGDLKPANFLFVRGVLKLIDFGIAKTIQSEDTTNIYRDSQIGTLNYMSPESILDSGTGKNGARMKCSRASDIWSLGCILYQMVYGKTPFAELHMIHKLQAITNPNYKIKFPEGADEAAVDAMKLCLRRNPQERPPIVGENGLLNEHWFIHSNRRRI